MCGLMLAFGVAAGIWQRRRTGEVARIDFSMIEAMLWTMAEPLLATQLGNTPKPNGNDSDQHFPHGVYRAAGDDDWLSLAATSDAEWRALCGAVPGLAGMEELGLDARRERRRAIDAALADWARPQPGGDAAASLRRAGVPAAALADTVGLVHDAHLQARGFWEPDVKGVLPGLPWRTSFGRVSGAAPGLGADTDAVLREVLELSSDTVAGLRRTGVLG